MLVVGTCLAVDRGKFRTCSQSAFCARNRPTATPPPQDQQQEQAQAESPQGVEKNAGLTAPYALGEVVEKSGEGGSRAVWASLVGKTERPLVLGMNVAAYGTTGEAEILRLTMSEERDDFAPVGAKRFGVGFDSQLASSFLTLKEDLAVPLSVVNDKGVFRIMAGGNTVATLEATLKSGGFTLNVTGAKNDPVVSLNSKGQFVFEHLREKLEEPQKPLEQPEQKEPEPEKPAEDIAGEVVDELGVMFENEEVRPEDEAGMLSSDNKQPAPTGTNEGLWSEYFGGHTDSKPHGPTAVGMDISFPGAKHVYGIPEHAAEFDLKTTTGTGSVYKDPYRMFNLDVFEYIVDDPMALYGSIPLMIAHSPTHSVGVLWLNPSETWVDVADGSSGKETWWISESGIVDVFILRGPTPKDIFEQVAALLGTTPIPPLFALGYHQCRWNYKDEPDVKQVDNDFDKYYIPYDVIWLDIEHTNGKRYFTWDEHKFPTPELMQDHLASKGRKLVTIVDPHIKRDSNYWIHTEATEKDLYVSRTRKLKQLTDSRVQLMAGLH
ncbi:alpha 1,3-glucosidase [Pelomyxa schiedti]|nr:alpha 1,3-glucosidase [Pelomyxa schiedti]